MKNLIVAASVLALSVPFVLTAHAADVEAVCLERMAEETDLPPEVTQDHINSFCSCLSGAVSADADLLAEFNEKEASDVEEEMSDAFNAEAKSCQEQALAG